MIAKWFCLALVAVGFVTMMATPWAIAFETWKERNSPLSEPNPVGVIVCVGICMFEVALALDWALGYAA